jgi:dienelactone hydrolase
MRYRAENKGISSIPTALARTGWGSRGRRFKSCRPDFWESLGNKAYRYLPTVGRALPPEPKAGVAWYGRLTSPKNELQPVHPLDLAASRKAPVLGLYGGADRGIPASDVEKMQAALEQAGGTSEIVLYPDTPHAFFADYRASYRDDRAQDGWKRLLEWLKNHGV